MRAARERSRGLVRRRGRPGRRTSVRAPVDDRRAVRDAALPVIPSMYSSSRTSFDAVFEDLDRERGRALARRHDRRDPCRASSPSARPRRSTGPCTCAARGRRRSARCRPRATAARPAAGSAVRTTSSAFGRWRMPPMPRADGAGLLLLGAALELLERERAARGRRSAARRGRCPRRNCTAARCARQVPARRSTTGASVSRSPTMNELIPSRSRSSVILATSPSIEPMNTLRRREVLVHGRPRRPSGPGSRPAGPRRPCAGGP